MIYVEPYRGDASYTLILDDFYLGEEVSEESSGYEPTILFGDANDDGTLDMKDVLALRKYLAGMKIYINILNADTNGDGSTDMKDVLVVRKQLAHLM